MKVQLYILIGLLAMAVLISLGGCNPSAGTPTDVPLSTGAETAKKSTPRPAEIFHVSHAPNIQPAFSFFGYEIKEATTQDQLNAIKKFQNRNGFRTTSGRLKDLPFRGAKAADEYHQRLVKIRRREMELEEQTKYQIYDADEDECPCFLCIWERRNTTLSFTDDTK